MLLQHFCLKNVLFTFLYLTWTNFSWQNLGQVFNFRRCCVYAMQLYYHETKLPNLKLKTRPKQPLASLPLDIALPESAIFKLNCCATQRLVLPLIFAKVALINFCSTNRNFSLKIFTSVWCQCYKTFFLRCWQWGQISWSVCTWQSLSSLV